MVDIMVYEPAAIIFMRQCIGFDEDDEDRNPVIADICRAHGVRSKEHFAVFIRSVADQLEKNHSF